MQACPIHLFFLTPYNLMLYVVNGLQNLGSRRRRLVAAMVGALFGLASFGSAIFNTAQLHQLNEDRQRIEENQKFLMEELIKTQPPHQQHHSVCGGSVQELGQAGQADPGVTETNGDGGDGTADPSLNPGIPDGTYRLFDWSHPVDGSPFVPFTCTAESLGRSLQ